jgi:hypothetical protein
MVRYHRYFSVLAKRYQRNYRFTRCILGIGAIVTALPLIEQIPSLVSSIGGVIVISFVIWDMVYDPGQKATALRAVDEGLTGLVDRHRALWNEIEAEAISDFDARTNRAAMHSEALNLIRGLGIPMDNALNEQCQKEAFESEADRYQLRGTEYAAG